MPKYRHALTAAPSNSVMPRLFTLTEVTALQRDFAEKCTALLTFNLDAVQRFNDITTLLEIVHVAYALEGTGAKFRAHLITCNMHARLLAHLDSLNALCRHAIQSGLITDAPDMPAYNEHVYSAAALCRDIQEGKPDAEHAIAQWLASTRSDFARNAAVHFRQLVAPGGQPQKPELGALYKVGLPLFRKHAASKTLWHDIRRDIDALLQAVIADGTATDDQRTVWQTWQKLSADGKRWQLRSVFKELVFGGQSI